MLGLSDHTKLRTIVQDPDPVVNRSPLAANVAATLLVNWKATPPGLVAQSGLPVPLNTPTARVWLPTLALVIVY